MLTLDCIYTLHVLSPNGVSDISLTYFTKLFSSVHIHKENLCPTSGDINKLMMYCANAYLTESINSDLVYLLGLLRVF
jgi:hypothetical protein